MYIEIMSGRGYNELEEVEILIHEGILHNKRFNVKPKVILPSIWRKKIPVTENELIQTVQSFGGPEANHQGSMEFYTELKRLLRM